MKQYLELVQQVLENGDEKPDRTGTGTLSVFGTQTRYDLREGFPLVTTKKVLFDSVVAELLWFIRGETNIRTLKYEDRQVHIWDEWAKYDGSIGPGYGKQWRRWEWRDRTSPGSSALLYRKIDQLQDVIVQIKKNPHSRRHLVSAWNVGELEDMQLHPCHLLFQLYVLDGNLDLQMYQRSADLMLGVPFNIASYALLLELIARECGLQPRYFIHSIGDAHIYKNHIEGARKQLAREPKDLPKIKLDNIGFFDVQCSDVELINYNPHPFIKFDVAV